MLVRPIVTTIVPPHRTGPIAPHSWENDPRSAHCCSCPRCACAFRARPYGGVAEWLKAHAWKACLRETVTWVRIPPPPLPPSSPPVAGLQKTPISSRFIHNIPLYTFAVIRHISRIGRG